MDPPLWEGEFTAQEETCVNLNASLNSVESVDSPNLSRDSLESSENDKSDNVLRPTFKSTLQAKKRLQAFCSANKLKSLYTKEEKIEETTVEKCEKLVQKKIKKPAYHDDKAKAVIEEIESIKRAEALTIQNRICNIDAFHGIKTSNHDRSRTNSISSDDERERFKRRAIKSRNYRKSTSFSKNSPERCNKRIEKHSKHEEKKSEPMKEYPKNWTEYKDQELTIEKDFELKLKYFGKREKTSPSNKRNIDLGKFYNFITPSPYTESLKCQSEKGDMIVVPFSQLRTTQSLPPILYSPCLHSKEERSYISIKQIFTMIPSKRRELIEKLYKTTTKTQINDKPYTERKWYPKNWKKYEKIEGKLLETSVGLSFLQTYSDEEENEEIETSKQVSSINKDEFSIELCDSLDKEEETDTMKIKKEEEEKYIDKTRREFEMLEKLINKKKLENEDTEEPELKEKTKKKKKKPKENDDGDEKKKNKKNNNDSAEESEPEKKRKKNSKNKKKSKKEKKSERKRKSKEKKKRKLKKNSSSETEEDIKEKNEDEEFLFEKALETDEFLSKEDVLPKKLIQEENLMKFLEDQTKKEETKVDLLKKNEEYLKKIKETPELTNNTDTIMTNEESEEAPNQEETSTKEVLVLNNEEHKSNDFAVVNEKESLQDTFLENHDMEMVTKEIPDWETIKNKRKRHMKDTVSEKNDHKKQKILDLDSCEDIPLPPPKTLEEMALRRKENWESDEERPSKLPERLNTSWESDEEVFDRSCLNFQREYISTKPVDSYSLEIPLNIKPFTRREIKLENDMELPKLEENNGNHTPKVLKTNVFEFGGAEMKNSTPGPDLSKVKTEKIDDFDLENSLTNTSATLENEYEEFLKAVTTTTEKPSKKHASSSSDSSSTESSSSSSSSDCTRKKKKKILKKLKKKREVKEQIIVRDLDELLPKHLDLNPIEPLQFPSNIPIKPVDPPKEEIIISTDVPIQSNTVLPILPKETLTVLPILSPKPEPVPCPKIDIKKPLINLSLSTNITQNITLNLATSLADISSASIDTPVTKNIDIIQTPSSDKPVNVPPSLGKPDDIMTLNDDFEPRLIDKPFVFTSMVLPSKKLVTNPGVKLDDSDNDDTNRDEEKKKNKPEALISEDIVKESQKKPEKRHRSKSRERETRKSIEKDRRSREIDGRRSSHGRREKSPRRTHRHSPPRRHSPRRRSPQRHRSPLGRRRRSTSPRHRRPSPKRRSPPKRSRHSDSYTLKRRRNSKSPKKDRSPPRKEDTKRSVADSTISDDLLPQSTTQEFESPANRFFDMIKTRDYDSPKREPLDVRIKQVLGISAPEKPQPITTTYANYDNYCHPNAYATDPYGQVMQNTIENQMFVASSSYDNVGASGGMSRKAPSNSCYKQVGNMLQIVPTEDVTAIQPQPPKTTVVQVGNMLQIVPTEMPDLSQIHLPLEQTSELPIKEEITEDVFQEISEEKQSAEAVMKLKVAERRAERELRRQEKEKRKKERERRRKEREKAKQLKLKIRTENMIKKALELEEQEAEDGNMDETPAQWPPIQLAAVHVTKEAGKSILIRNNSKSEQDESCERKRTEKLVQFADGVRPGEGTSTSGGEELSSPPPTRKKMPKEKRYKKTKLVKKKKKKKGKVKIIKKRATQDTEDSDEEYENLPPPSPPPGSPPPHLFPPRIKTHTINNVQPAFLSNIVQNTQYQQLFRPPISIIMAPPPPPHHHGPPGPPHHGPPPPGPPHHHGGPPGPHGPPHHGPPGPPHHGPPPPHHHGPPPPPGPPGGPHHHHPY